MSSNRQSEGQGAEPQEHLDLFDQLRLELGLAGDASETDVIAAVKGLVDSGPTNTEVIPTIVGGSSKSRTERIRDRVLQLQAQSDGKISPRTMFDMILKEFRNADP